MASTKRNREFNRHVRRIRYLIESSEEHSDTILHEINVTMRCGKILVDADSQSADVAREWNTEYVILLGLATAIKKRISRHVKKCMICGKAMRRRKIKEEEAA
jgi:hypothetical protein